jgi:predicted flap endonuclease-1-like 5' DNA nuclease
LAKLSRRKNSMSVDRSTRSAFAALLLIAALFIAMNRIVASAPLGDWWLPLVLFILGAALLPNWDFSRSQPNTDEEDQAQALLGSDVHTYRISEQQVPRLHTMTIRPDPESAEYRTVTVTEEALGQSDILPFIEADISGGGTSTARINNPAAAPSFMSQTEAANPDLVMAKTEAPIAPAADDSVTATPREPEKEVIAEKTAAPQQPYEAAQVGTITPEQVDQVMNDAPAAVAPLVSEVASPVIAAQERDGAGTVGSADDLARLNGIGPKSAAALKAAGIDSFHKLANSSEDQIRAAVAGVRLVGDVTTWAQQAAYAARGDWAGLTEFNNAQRKAANGD